jgi:hypothetical protein
MAIEAQKANPSLDCTLVQAPLRRRRLKAMPSIPDTNITPVPGSGTTAAMTVSPPVESVLVIPEKV